MPVLSLKSSRKSPTVARFHSRFHGTGALSSAVRLLHAAGRERSQTVKNGSVGQVDYYTSCDVHPILAQSLAEQIRQVDDRWAIPIRSRSLKWARERACWPATSSKDCAAQSDSFFRRLNYVLIERSPAMRAAQRNNLASVARFRPTRVLGRPAGRYSCGKRRRRDVSRMNWLTPFRCTASRSSKAGSGKYLSTYENGPICEHLQDVSIPELFRILRTASALLASDPSGRVHSRNQSARSWPG